MMNVIAFDIKNVILFGVAAFRERGFFLLSLLFPLDLILNFHEHFSERLCLLWNLYV